jgi:riboflavin kinase/FMN adenylyltransferase
MRLFRHYSEVPVEARGAVVAIGNFDGIHRGHQAVIARAAEQARALGTRHAVLTFEPHPRSWFRPADEPFRLTPFRTKVRQLEAIGIDHLFVLHFDADLAGKSAEAFVVEVLSEGLDVAHVVVGYDFVFGQGRRGNAALLAELGRPRGFAVTTVEPVAGPGGEVFSSTKVREHLSAGRPDAATRQLGRPWEIEGRVEHGDQRGRTLGFPTANLALGEYLRPALGVYAIRAGIDEGRGTVWRDGVANLGRRPTVGGTRVQLEVHLFDFAGDLYGRHLRVALIDHLRAERKFDGLPALKAQIAEDGRQARERLAAYDGPPPGAVPPPLPAPAEPGDSRSLYERTLSPRRDAET